MTKRTRTLYWIAVILSPILALCMLMATIVFARLNAAEALPSELGALLTYVSFALMIGFAAGFFWALGMLTGARKDTYQRY